MAQAKTTGELMGLSASDISAIGLLVSLFLTLILPIVLTVMLFGATIFAVQSSQWTPKECVDYCAEAGLVPEVPTSSGRCTCTNKP
jgi:hypothetical protein